MERLFLAKLLEKDAYKEKYHQYLQELVGGYFKSGLFENAADQLDASKNKKKPHTKVGKSDS